MAPRVLIVWHTSLFREIVEAVLTQAGLEVIKAAHGCEEAQLWIERESPPTVVAERVDEAMSCLWEYVRDQPNVRLICVSLEDNELHVYSHRRHVLIHVQELVSVLVNPTPLRGTFGSESVIEP